MMVAGKGLRKMEKKAQENFSYAQIGLTETLIPTLSPSSLLYFFLNVTDVVLLSHEGEKVSPEGGKKVPAKKKASQKRQRQEPSKDFCFHLLLPHNSSG